MLRALTGLMLIIFGGLIPSAILIPKLDLSTSIIPLASTWQVSSLLLCSLVCGSRSSSIAAFAYLIIGLFYLPVFHGGGSVGYMLTPGFGYLAGFIPAAWISGRLAERIGKRDPVKLTLCSLVGLTTLQLFGIVHLILGSFIGIWSTDFFQLLYTYTLAPLPSQIILSTAIGMIAALMKLILLI